VPRALLDTLVVVAPRALQVTKQLAARAYQPHAQAATAPPRGRGADPNRPFHSRAPRLSSRPTGFRSRGEPVLIERSLQWPVRDVLGASRSIVAGDC
jgi:hypothetical protein